MARGRGHNTDITGPQLVMSTIMDDDGHTIATGDADVDCLELDSLNITDSEDQCVTVETNTCKTVTETSGTQYLITDTEQNTDTDRRMLPNRCSKDEGFNGQALSVSDRLPVPSSEDNVSVMSSDVTSVYTQDKDGDTDLHIGIIQKEILLVMSFISAAPNSECLNIVNLHLQTPLHLAVITKQVDIVRRLMTSGARIDICDIHGNTPLHIACREGYVDIVRCLLQPVYFEETQVKQYNIPYQRIPHVLNRRNRDGHTCLHLAALSTHLKVLELLVSEGADVNSRDGTSGRTILHYAAETGNRILLYFLLSHRKINICCRTYGGLTPLILAAGREYGDIVSILLDHGAEDTDIYEFNEEFVSVA